MQEMSNKFRVKNAKTVLKNFWLKNVKKFVLKMLKNV